MARWVDFAAVRAQVSLEQVLFEYYRLTNLTRRGNTIVGPCPVHGGESPRAFNADLSRNVWHCFSRCQGGGNQLDFVAKREGISIREAALRLQDFFGVGGVQTPTPPKVASTTTASSTRAHTPAANPPLKVHLTLAHDHPHLLNDRGLQRSTCEHFDVGYCRRGMMRGCIAFPIHDTHGELVAYAGRRLKPQDARAYGKYKLPKGFRKELTLYNYHRAKTLMHERGLILVEGFFTVLKLYELGFENVVACMGTELSDAQVGLLAAAPSVLVLFDGDEAGRRGANTAMLKLSERTLVRVATLPIDTEPDELGGRAVKWLIHGMQLLNLASVHFELHR